MKVSAFIAKTVQFSASLYPYKKNGILPDGLRIPDIPIMKLLFVRRDLKRGLVGESIIDTGFDAGVYADLNLVEFLEGSKPRRTTSLQAAGHSVSCEVYDVECHVADQDSKPVLSLGKVEAYCPIDLVDLSEDVIVGRAILNRIRLELNGRLTKLSM